MSNNKLSLEQSYLAMQLFLEKYYNLTGSDDIGSLLGSMQMSDDGKTMDPAIWDDWLSSVEKTLENSKKT